MSGYSASWNRNRLTGRPALSSNWRVKEDPRPDQAVEPTHWERSLRSSALDEKQQSPPELVAPLRESADEKRAKQAILDGRRLWVGNLRYTAKEDDVRALFLDSTYEV